jgi:hypothetical protein
MLASGRCLGWRFLSADLHPPRRKKFVQAPNCEHGGNDKANPGYRHRYGARSNLEPPVFAPVLEASLSNTIYPAYATRAFAPTTPALVELKRPSAGSPHGGRSFIRRSASISRRFRVRLKRAQPSSDHNVISGDRLYPLLPRKRTCAVH